MVTSMLTVKARTGQLHGYRLKGTLSSRRDLQRAITVLLILDFFKSWPHSCLAGDDSDCSSRTVRQPPDFVGF